MGNHGKLTAREREERFLAGRVARVAQEVLDGTDGVRPGNVVSFPLMVVDQRVKAYGDFNMQNRVGKAAPLREYPFSPDREPGPFPRGETTVRIASIDVGAVSLSYWFNVAVGVPLSKPAYGFEMLRGTEEQARVVLGQLPKGIEKPCLSSRRVKALLHRAISDGEAARNDLAQEGLALVATIASRTFDRFTANSLATPEDVRAGAHEHIVETIERFCSPARPQGVTWGRALFMSGRRDMDRAFHALEPEREDLRTVRSRIEKHLHTTTDPEELHRLVCRDSTRIRLRKQFGLISLAEIEVMVDAAEASGALDNKISLAKIRRVLESPERSVVSPDTPLSADGTGGTIADVVAGTHDRDVTEYSLQEAALVLCGDNVLMADLMGPFFHCMGLASATDDASRPRALPSTGPLGRLTREMFGPFLKPGEVWTKAEHRDNARKRAYEAFTENGRLRPAEEIGAVWREVVGSNGLGSFAAAAMAAMASVEKRAATGT